MGATREEVDAVARAYWEAGVRHIVALRGDPPAGASAYTPHPGGYAYAADLVAGLKRIAPFEITVAAYPETHPAALSPEADLDNLKRKIDAGATRAITQYFFDTDVYLRFLDRCLAAGITVPIVPGILPVTNFAQVVKFSAMCGATVPGWMAALFEGLEEDAETRRLVAAVVAAEQVRLLQANGVDEFHFYTLEPPRPDVRHRPYPRRAAEEARPAGLIRPPRRGRPSREGAVLFRRRGEVRHAPAQGRPCRAGRLRPSPCCPQGRKRA